MSETAGNTIGSPGPPMEVRCLLNQYCHSGAPDPARPRGPGSSCRWPGWPAGRAPARGGAPPRGRCRGRARWCGPGPFEALGAEGQQPGHGRRQPGGGVAQVDDLVADDQAGPRTSVRRGRSWPVAPLLLPRSARLRLEFLPVLRGVRGPRRRRSARRRRTRWPRSDEHDQRGQRRTGVADAQEAQRHGDDAADQVGPPVGQVVVADGVDDVEDAEHQEATSRRARPR